MSKRSTPSIRDFDRPDDRIRLHVQVDARPVALVEGESDRRFIQKLSSDEVVAFSCGGRPNALSVTASLVGNISNEIACVVDRDFDDFSDGDVDGLPVFPYENADLEGMLCVAGAVSELVAEFGSASKLEQAGGLDVVEKAILSIALKVAALRRANAQHRWGLAFDSVDIARKVDGATIQLKTEPYCRALAATSESAPQVSHLIDIATGSVQIADPAICPRVGARYFRGRDYLAVLGVTLTRKIGSQRRESVDSETLARVLRLSCASAPWVQQWYSDLRRFMREWSAA